LTLRQLVVKEIGSAKDISEMYLWIVSTSMERTEQENGITKGNLILWLHHDDVEGMSFIKVMAIVTEAKVYNVLVGAMVLYMLGFTLDFEEDFINDLPKIQVGNDDRGLDV
jgi:hypothetical protein